MKSDGQDKPLFRVRHGGALRLLVPFKVSEDSPVFYSQEWHYELEHLAQSVMDDHPNLDDVPLYHPVSYWHQIKVDLAEHVVDECSRVAETIMYIDCVPGLPLPKELVSKLSVLSAEVNKHLVGEIAGCFRQDDLRVFALREAMRPYYEGFDDDEDD